MPFLLASLRQFSASPPPPADLSRTTCHLLTSFSPLASNSPLALQSHGVLGMRGAPALNTALAGVIAHRDSRSLVGLADAPPRWFSPSPSRGGSSRTRRSTNETRRRCQDWLNGVRLELWDPPRKMSTRTQTQDRKHQPETSFDLDDRTSTKVHSLIAEGALRRACVTLTAEPPVPPTTQVVDELRLLHPGPTDAHKEELSKLRPVSPGAAPDADVDQVRRALASFASTSGAGPSGLRPSHLQDALRYSSGDLTLRLLAEVVSLMMKGELPEDIRPWLCGAALMALRKPNKSLRPVAVGETLRRLCSKVCVDQSGPSWSPFRWVFKRSRPGCGACRSVQRVQLRLRGGSVVSCAHPLSLACSMGGHMLPL